jgi:hypothetical protein
MSTPRSGTGTRKRGTQTKKRHPRPTCMSRDRFVSIYMSEDFRSNDGMLTGVWGPCMWHYLHTMSFNYPVHPTDEQKQHYRDFVLSLEHVLPCGKCRTNLAKNFKKLPLTMKDMASRDTFSKYMYRLHELVNRMLGKKSGLSYVEVREKFEHFRARCHNKTTIRRRKKDLEKHEKGCVYPLTGKPAKCVIHIQ